MVPAVNRETRSSRGSTRGIAQNTNEAPSTGNNCDSGVNEDGAIGRRVLRSKYLTVKNRISDERDDISKVDSDKFKSIIAEVDGLHQHVTKPREQVADAEALFDIANTLVTSVQSYCNEGTTPSDFVSSLIRDFGEQGGPNRNQDAGATSIRWEEIGLAVSHVFRSAPGCCTMVGPMNTEVKPCKQVARKKRARPTTRSQPEELDESASEEKTDTDRNMATMFDILRKKRKVNLANLILNRNAFAQTVENLFALSFLVKDGRAEITVDEKNCHLVSPKNAPGANAILSGEVSYNHFIFRFDFRDWKLMLASVEDGEELMPHRDKVNISSNMHPTSDSEVTQAAHPTTPIKKLSRNRGLVRQEQTVVEDSPENRDSDASRLAIRKGKRKLL
ncbi:Non-structural maintenance of chromosomes element 4A [Abeliophyllum distichum]|uniref:Non-structural maintenance of chromosomes element 4 n=1 Tax=Abeliophyllum distichum TaxID=126358 RepID=A0ABD1R031_9LAMI